MAAINENKRLLAPLLDRLSDINSHTKDSPIKASHQVLKQLRESVRRDLEHLFNTRYRCVSPENSHQHLHRSLINFGLPDISTVNLTANSSRQRFCRDVEQAILNFDPRIKSVSVFSDKAIDPEDPAIRFRIEATLHANPAPETIIFDSALNPINHSMNVSEVG
ncbi:MAG: type VI secretion system baseplate subunit TssE [Spongiibacteraceae bacterium]